MIGGETKEFALPAEATDEENTSLVMDGDLEPVRSKYYKKRHSATIPEGVELPDGFDDEDVSNLSHDASRIRPSHNQEAIKRRSTASASGVRKANKRRELSFASASVDFGNKGYLTDLEQKLRSYDEDGDGKFSRAEVLKIVQNLDRQETKSRGYRRTICGISSLVVVLLLTVFGLMVGTVYLTRLVGTGGDGEVLVNAKTKQALKTKSVATTLSIDRERNIEEDDGDEERILQNARETGRNFVGFIMKDKWETAFSDLQDGNYVNLLTTSLNNVTHVEGVSDIDGLVIEDTISLYRSSETVQVFLSSEDNADYRVRGLYEASTCPGEEGEQVDCRVYHHVDCPAGVETKLKCELYKSMSFIPVVSGVTSKSAVIWFKADSETRVRVRVSTGEKTSFFPNDGSVFVTEATDYTGTIVVDGLSPSTKYVYKVLFDGYPLDTGYLAYFKTFPDMTDEFDPYYDKIQFSVFSDAAYYKLDQPAVPYRQGGNRVTADQHLFAMQIGDFDHSDPTSLDEMRLMHSMLRDPTRVHGKMLAGHILTRMPFIHIWDDHDYCGQDTDKTCPLKSEAFQAYKEYYPSYDFPSEDGIWFSFEAGHAEVFVLDTRSQRDPDILPDPQDGTSMKSMLDGDNIDNDQITWLKNGLTSSTKPWKIIISTVSANKLARPGNIDHWMTGFRSEAIMLRDWIASQQGLVQPSLRDEILMISGDLHSGGGIDDGCNNGFNVAELAVAHTNLVKGNTGNLGAWTEGYADGSTTGFGRVTVEEHNLIAEALDADGNVLVNLTLPHSATEGCPDRSSEGAFIECSSNLHNFRAPDTTGLCVDIEKQEWQAYPFFDEDGTEIQNKVTWYECPEEGRRIMVSNDIPDHDIIRYNNYEPCERFWYVDMPLNPEVMFSGLFEPSHIMGFALNGVVAYGPLELTSQNAVELEILDDPNAEQVKDARYWFGHNGAATTWHYHHPFLGKNKTLTSEDHIGYAMDGFPIYGPLDEPDSVLDACNFDYENKRYHIRLLTQVDETLPYCNADQEEVVNWNYIIGCHVANPRLTNVMDSTSSNAVIYEDCVEVTYQ